MVMYKNGRWFTDFWVGRKRYGGPTEFTDRERGKAKAVKLQAKQKAAIVAEIARIEALNVRNGRGKIIDQPLCDGFSAYWEQHAKNARAFSV